MAVTVYRSSDASAPVALPNSASIIAVLYACLVTGYGAKAGSGWTRPYTGTNLAVFRQATGTSNFYLRVDENTVPGGALLRGYETMSAVSTGSRLFPTTVQEPNPGGMFIPKGSNENTAMDWMVVATGAAFWLFIKPKSANIGAPYDFAIPFFFGDIESYKTSDLYKCMIIGALYSAESPSYGIDPAGHTFQRPLYTDGLGTVNFGTCIARSYTAAIGSQPVGFHSDYHRNNAQMETGGIVQFPNPVDGGIYASKVYVHEYVASNYIIRGALPGIWQLSHAVTAFNLGDTYNGSGDFAGKTFEFVRVRSGLVSVEVSNTW